jgi:60 kDa SS-A/Ro ribonucleoprotein
VLYTDSETHDQDSYPSLLKHRERFGTAGHGVIVAMAASHYTLFPDDDPLCLNVVGFDTATPQIVSEFVSGAL